MSKWLVDIHGELEGDYELICKAESTIPLDKVKKAREEIEKQSYPESSYGFGYGKDKVVSMDLVWEILDKLITESEEKE